MKRLIHSDTTTLGFQIAPMIDVVFVIMLFLKAKLPGPDNLTQLIKFPAEEITIGILEDGTVTMNDEAFDSPQDKALPSLTTTLHRLAQSSARQKQDVLVTIQAEEQATYERVIDVLNSLHRAAIQNVTFTVGTQPL